MPPITKVKDEHYTNLIHLLEYYDYLKISGYNSHCLSFNKTTYLCLYCSECKKYFLTLTFLTNHKWTRHSHKWSKKKFKSQIEQNSLTFDDFSLLLFQQEEKMLLLNKMTLKEYASDRE